MTTRGESMSGIRVVVRVLAFALAFAIIGNVVERFTRLSKMRNGVVEGTAPNVFRLTGGPDGAASAEDFARLDPKCPTVLLLGSSQSGSVTSLSQGGQVTWDLGGTTIDELALLSNHPKACFVRIVMGAILPAEMAVFAGTQVEAVAPPKLVIMELHWESLAHDITFREAPRRLLANRSFRTRFLDDMRASGAPSSVVSAFERWGHDADAETAAENARPVGLRLDDLIFPVLRKRVPWFANLDTQVSVQRFLVLPLLGMLTHGHTSNQHEIVAPHLAFNLDAVRAVASYLKLKHVPLLVFRGPRRHHILPMTDLTGEAATMASLERELQSLGAFVLDLSDAVPDEMFGWAGENADRMHFSLPAHHIVADTLIREGRALGAFAALDSTP